MSRALSLLFAIVCYAIFFATFLYLIAFVGDLPVPKTIDGPASAMSREMKAVIDVALIAAISGLMPGPLQNYSKIENPLRLAGAHQALNAALTVTFVVLLAVLLASAASLIIRSRRSRGALVATGHTRWRSSSWTGSPSTRAINVGDMVYPPECYVGPSRSRGGLAFCAMPSRRGAP